MTHTFKIGDKVRLLDKEVAAVKAVKEWKEGDRYWYIESYGEVEFSNWDGVWLDKATLAFGNVFRTKAHAEAAAARVKKALRNEI